MSAANPPASPNGTNKKCCGKCAFRVGSPERADPYGWIWVMADRENGSVFYCHESVPGHHQEVADGTPRWRVCAGYAATRGSQDKLWRLPLIDQRIGGVESGPDEWGTMTAPPPVPTTGDTR